MWQGEDEWEEGVGVNEDQAAMLAQAEQVVRAAQQLIGEQVRQLVRHKSSRIKAARTQAAPSARTSSSSSSSSDSG